ncbi:MAG: serine/threonine-protein kinase [Pseudomonadota bacterium]
MIPKISHIGRHHPPYHSKNKGTDLIEESTFQKTDWIPISTGMIQRDKLRGFQSHKKPFASNSANCFNTISGLLLFAETSVKNNQGSFLESFTDLMASPYYWLFCVVAGLVKIGFYLHNRRMKQIYEVSEELEPSSALPPLMTQQDISPLFFQEGANSIKTTLVSTPLDFSQFPEESLRSSTEESIINGNLPVQTISEDLSNVGSKKIDVLDSLSGKTAVENIPKLRRTDIETSNICPHCQRPNEEEDKLCHHCAFPLELIEGRYRLVGTISSEGGQGVVYKAIHLGLKRADERAIKVIKLEPTRMDEKKKRTNDAIRRRFYLEIDTLHELSSVNEHIVRIHDTFDEKPWLGLYYVMEYLDGITLDKIIRDKGNPDLKRILHIFSQICEAISAVHKAEIVHRDLKPANIMLIEKGDDRDFVKIIDFGIVKDLTQRNERIQTQSCIGTPQYMPPEQWLNEQPTPQTDIYALGFILYELLTGGKLPLVFDKRDSLTVATRHLTGARIPMSQHSGFSHLKPLDEIVLRALKPKSYDRYSSVQEFLDAVIMGFERIL